MKQAMKTHRAAKIRLYNAASVTEKTDESTKSYLKARAHFHKAERDLILKMNGVKS